MSTEQLIEDFKSFFGGLAPTILSFAPGRLNFIGEHVDYLGGNVVPAAIDFGCNVLMSVEDSSASPSSLINLSTDTVINFAFISKEIDTEKGPIAFSLPSDAATLQKNKSLRTILTGAMLEGRKLISEIQKDAVSTSPNTTSPNTVTIKGLISSTIPVGAGLSSSAALCVALIQGLAFAALPKEEATRFFSAPSADANAKTPAAEAVRSVKNSLAKAARAVENAHCGTNCGIMDQFASINGRRDTILQVDCDAMTYNAVPLFPPSVGQYQVLLINSMRAHDLGSNYNEVCADLFEAERKVNIFIDAEKIRVVGSSEVHCMTLKELAGKRLILPNDEVHAFTSLDLIDFLSTGAVTDTTPFALKQRVVNSELPPIEPRVILTPREYGRVSYAVSEMQRVVTFVSIAGSSSADVVAKRSTPEAILKSLGELLYKTHDGLANQLLVSTAEIDTIVSICRTDAAVKSSVLGARLMGGGFGGCVLAVVDKSAVESVIAAIQSQFASAFPELGPCAIYKVTLMDGASARMLL